MSATAAKPCSTARPDTIAGTVSPRAIAMKPRSQALKSRRWSMMQDNPVGSGMANIALRDDR
ncbi:MAG: hypothetical protein RIB80_08175 [Rhodospirillales bacterium]